MGNPHSATLGLPNPDDIHVATLDNGITVIARANLNSPSIVIQGYLHAGSIYDDDEQLGLADFTAEMLMRGTLARSHLDIYDQLESTGASLSFNAATHTASFGGRSLAEDIPMLLRLARESLETPAFPKDEIEKLRAQALTGLSLRADNPEAVASISFDQLIYPNHPYGRPEDGFPDTIERISAADIGAFHHRYFGPEGMHVVIVGGLEPQQAVDAVAAELNDWHNPEQVLSADLPGLERVKTGKRQHDSIPGKSQTALVMGAAGPTRKSADFLAASLGNHVFGQFGMYGRVGEVVREQAGLAYYVYSSLGGGVGPGPWSVAAGVDPEDLEQAISLITAEIGKLVESGVTADELEDSKASYIGSLPLSMESNAGVAGALVNLARFDLGLDYFLGYADRVQTVTPEEVRLAVRRYLDPVKLVVTSAGPEL
jgi:zinc protease